MCPGEKRQGKHARIYGSGTTQATQREAARWSPEAERPGWESTKQVLHIALSVKLKPRRAKQKKASSVTYRNNCNF